jgi:hypothetical protein
MTDNLKPCPFCGGVAEAWDYGIDRFNHEYRVGCASCYIAEVIELSADQAASLWNTRPDHLAEKEAKKYKEALRELVGDVEQLLTPIQDGSLPTNKIIGYFLKSLLKAKEAMVDES